MVLVARNDLGIIKRGMRFVFINELEEHVETFCVELKMNFKLNKEILDQNFTIYYR